MGKIFTAIYSWIQRKPKSGFALLLLIILLSALSVSRLHFVEDISRIVPENKEEIAKTSALFSRARLMEKVVFTLTADDSIPQSNLLAAYASRFIQQLDSLRPEYISEIQGRVPQRKMLGYYNYFYRHLPLYLTEDDYKTLDSLLQKEQIEAAIKADYRAFMLPAEFGMKSFIRRDPLSLTRLGLNKLQSFRPNDDFSLEHEYIFTADRKTLLFFVSLAKPKQSDKTLEFEQEVRKIEASLKKIPEYQKIKIDFFGAPMVAAANAQQIKKDIQLTVSIAVLLLLIIITLFFKSARAVFIIFMPALLGALVSLALLALFKPELSLISLGIGAVLLGISVDFALHIYAHYRENENIDRIFDDLSEPILISSLTTGAAFASLMLLKSEVMGDLGVFLAISVVSSALFSLLLFPHLLKKKKSGEKAAASTWIDALARVDLSRKKYVVIAVLLITAFFLFSDKGVYFDRDLYKSNYMPPGLRQSESHINQIIGSDKNRSVYIASFGRSLEEALEQNESLAPGFKQIVADSIAPQIVNISQIVPSLKTQKERLKRWNNYWTPDRRKQVREMILEAARPYKFKESSFSAFYDFIDSNHTQTVPLSDNILYQQLARDYVVELDSGFAVISQADVPKEGAAQNRLQEIFAGSSALVMDKLHYAQEIISGLKQGFDQLVYISLGLVFLILLISFGRIELAVISFLPVSVSWLWIVGIMDLFGLQFNIFNVIILSFVFGLGIDYSIFYMRGLILDHKYGAHPQKTYRASIILSVITSVIGIGVLIFAKHPAMRSIALMSVIGILTIILITFTLIPLAFRWLVSYSGGKRRKVVTAVDTFNSILFFIGYVSGSLTMTLLIPFFMIFPAPRRKKRDVYRYFIKVFSAYIFLHPTIPIKIINEQKENFKKPAIIIANHQSVIDIMLMLLLSNKILIVTNERVWKHWLWGAVLRYAEYYPAFAEFDDMHRRIEEKVKQGYSIMIFPEGTRSQTGKIKRFHKGAFYMAQSLGVDILPILLHGVHECLRKGEFFLFTGKITMKIMPRIDLQSGVMGTTMRDQAKAMTAYFRREYEELRKEVAGVDYYSVHLTRNYIYKGPVLEWYFRVKFRMEDRYRMFDQLIPRDAKIYDLGCGYGFLSLMLGLISPERQIRGLDFDDEKIKVAQNSAIREEGVQFHCADITQFTLEQADIFLLLDTLHYFAEQQQIALIEQCVAKLNEGGKIIIRDANKDIAEKHKSTELTERLSTGIGFNKAKFSDLHFMSETLIRKIAQDNNMKLEVISESKRLSNRVYVMSR
jgi:1-acyl-sn-glycerol-3-phosphate acyltransferase